MARGSALAIQSIRQVARSIRIVWAIELLHVQIPVLGLWLQAHVTLLSVRALYWPQRQSAEVFVEALGRESSTLTQKAQRAWRLKGLSNYLTTSSWACNPTCSLPNWPLLDYPNSKRTL